MASNGPAKPNGKTLQHDPTITDSVIAATGSSANPRLAAIIPSLVRHLHDFAREVDLTVAEWMAGVELVSQNLNSNPHCARRQRYEI